jgi:hypothetical protein
LAFPSQVDRQLHHGRDENAKGSDPVAHAFTCIVTLNLAENIPDIDTIITGNTPAYG